MSKGKTNFRAHEFKNNTTGKQANVKDTSKPVREEPRKDSPAKRVNMDNMRADKFRKEFVQRTKPSKGRRATDNDFSWYNRNPELLTPAANLGFGQVSGLPMQPTSYIVPGIMAFYWYPTIGGYNEQTAVNQAKEDIYSYTVHANSRNTSYSAEDQFMFFLACKDVFVSIAHLIRVYGIMLKYESQNGYTPRALLNAMSFNVSDLVENYSHMLYDINELIARTRQLWIPDIFPVVQRQFWMSTNIYVDSESVKGQYYMYVPGAAYQLEETAFDTGTSLSPIRTWSQTRTWSESVNLINSMLDKLIKSEYRGVICGDVLKAFGSERIFKLNFIDPNYEVSYVKNPEVMTQFENLTAPYMPMAWNNIPWIYQNVDKQTIGYTSKNQEQIPIQSFMTWPRNVFLNFHKPGQPTTEEVTVATRMSAAGVSNLPSSPGNAYAFVPWTCGTEVCMQINVSKLQPDGVTIKKYPLSSVITTDGTLYTDKATIRETLCAWSAFDWAPQIQFHDATKMQNINSVTTNSLFDLCYEIDNCLALNDDELSRLHIACIKSEFGVPVL